MSSAPHRIIEHITEIDAPISEVWQALIHLDDWQWNQWTRLEAELPPARGVKGKLHASYAGDDNWKVFPFEFAEVSHEAHLLSWFGQLGPGGCLFRGHHSMQLEAISTGDSVSLKTRLIHREEFGGLLPWLKLGLPYRQLDQNYLLMNQALKQFVEQKSRASFT